MDWKDLQQITWQGYARQNGGKGIRNRVLVLYTVKCAEFVAQRIVAPTWNWWGLTAAPTTNTP